MLCLVADAEHLGETLVMLPVNNGSAKGRLGPPASPVTYTRSGASSGWSGDGLPCAPSISSRRARKSASATVPSKNSCRDCLREYMHTHYPPDPCSAHSFVPYSDALRAARTSSIS